MDKKKEIDRLISMEDEKVGKVLSMNINKEKIETECPSSEDLACFIEGKLDGVLRGEIMGHMSSCDDCYGTFTGTIEILGEIEEDECNEAVYDNVREEDELPVEKLISFRSIIFKFMAYPLAAAAAILIMVFVFRGISSNEQSFVQKRVAALSEEMAKEAAPSLYKHESPYYFGFSDTYSERGVDFSIGVCLTDLEIAMATEDKESVLALLNDVTGFLKGRGMVGKSLAYYENIKKAINEGASLEAIAVHIDSAVNEVLSPDYVRFGQWCEGGRIAAINSLGGFYYLKDIETFIKWQNSENLARGVLLSLRKIESIVSEGTYNEKQSIQLEKEFANIMLLLRT
ncbi:MAG: hypothetical protein GY941_23125 [Planctomycetes bacterium]|nr:hypothetical protein [Planctomycetota bacterium]